MTTGLFQEKFCKSQPVLMAFSRQTPRTTHFSIVTRLYSLKLPALPFPQPDLSQWFQAELPSAVSHNLDVLPGDGSFLRRYAQLRGAPKREWQVKPLFLIYLYLTGPPWLSDGFQERHHTCRKAFGQVAYFLT